MKTYTHEGCYGEDTVYVLETLDDWDEYEKTIGPEVIKSCYRSFNAYKADFKKYIGQILRGTGDVRYKINDEPVYNEYKIIAMEDDTANADWYWVIQNVDDDRDIKYYLVNDPSFYDHLK